jgi:hypothetical protein
MIHDMTQQELEDLHYLSDRKDDFPQEMTEGDWFRYNELRDKRFEGE